jgi:hypothetical protein
MKATVTPAAAVPVSHRHPGARAGPDRRFDRRIVMLPGWTAASGSATGRQAPPAADPDPASANGRLVRLRQQLADKARKLAAAEDETARLHEDIAAQRLDRAAESLRIAGRARSAAQPAREIADNHSPSEDHYGAGPATGGPAPAGGGDCSRAADDRSRDATTTDPAGSAETGSPGNVHYAAAANDVQLASRLWQASETLTGLASPTSLDLHNPGPGPPCCEDSPLERGLAPGWSRDVGHRRSG